MSKKTLLRKLENPKLEDYNKKRLEEDAREEGISLKGVMTKKEIIVRLNNPAKSRL